MKDHAWNVKSQWVKLPNREDSPVNLHYQRLLSVSESCNSIIQPVPPDTLTAVTLCRLTIGRIHGIPPLRGEPVSAQFQPPTDFSGKLTIPSAVRHIAHKYTTSPDDPTARLVSIKFYRVRRSIIQPGAMARGLSPLDEALNYPFYLGEFFPNGENVNLFNDPYLYWLIPVYRDPRDDNPKTNLRDHLEQHANLVYNRKLIEEGPKNEEQP